MVNFRPKAERDFPNDAGPVPVIFQIKSITLTLAAGRPNSCCGDFGNRIKLGA